MPTGAGRRERHQGRALNFKFSLNPPAMFCLMAGGGIRGGQVVGGSDDRGETLTHDPFSLDDVAAPV